MKKLLFAGLGLVVSGAIAAEDVTGVTRMVCASGQAQICLETGSCHAATPWELAVPDFVIIPTVGKGGIGIGGARGKGLLYEGGQITAEVTLSQLTIGFQWGGQAYSEFIFFKDDVALADFKRGNYELGAQASAVAVTAGASADANYSDGVAIFTQAKGGLMYEASVGGQKFKVKSKK